MGDEGGSASLRPAALSNNAGEQEVDMDIPLESRFKVICEITRAQHFAWREAALILAPHLDAEQPTNKM